MARKTFKDIEFYAEIYNNQKDTFMPDLHIGHDACGYNMQLDGVSVGYALTASEAYRGSYCLAHSVGNVHFFNVFGVRIDLDKFGYSEKKIWENRVSIEKVNNGHDILIVTDNTGSYFEWDIDEKRIVG